jgi:uncharacterized protein YjbI with pentapeptide repeats
MDRGPQALPTGADSWGMPTFKETPLSLSLREGGPVAPADRQTGTVDLAGSSLRGADLRRTDLRKADLRDAYCHSADLRGVDLSGANIEGASFHMARVAGAYFPGNVSADEIRLSLEIGTRIRCR